MSFGVNDHSAQRGWWLRMCPSISRLRLVYTFVVSQSDMSVLLHGSKYLRKLRYVSQFLCVFLDSEGSSTCRIIGMSKAESIVPPTPAESQVETKLDISIAFCDNRVLLIYYPSPQGRDSCSHWAYSSAYARAGQLLMQRNGSQDYEPEIGNERRKGQIEFLVEQVSVTSTGSIEGTRIQ